ncbi:MAG: hypothetical protein ABI396_18735 [Ktedonobacteraceae bacterium]
MYISIEQLGISLRKLDPINPFFGVSFLAFKESGLRIGDPQPVNIAEEETSILEAYYNPLPASDYYYMPLRKTGPKKRDGYPKESIRQVLFRKLEPLLLLELLYTQEIDPNGLGNQTTYRSLFH